MRGQVFRWGGHLMVVVFAACAAYSANYAAQVYSSDVRSYRLWVTGDLSSWTVSGPYPVVVNLVWWPLRWINADDVNRAWVLGWTAPATLLACLVLWRSTRYPRLAISTWLLGATLLERSYWLRLDAIPALLALVAIAAARRGRVVASALALSLGALVKIWPLFLVPIVLLAVPAGSRWRWVRWFAGPWLLFLAVVAAVRPPGAMTWFTFTFGRRIQIESLTALGPLWAMATGRKGWTIFYASGLDHAHLITGRHLTAIHLGLEAVAVVVLLAVAWRMRRLAVDSGRQAPGAAISDRVLAAGLLAQTVALGVVIAAGPVFSPQYLTWFAPLVAYGVGEGIIGAELAVWLAACFLTTLDYPYFFDRLRRAQLVAVQVVTARDAVLALFLAVCAARFWQLTRRGSASVGASGRAGRPASADDRPETQSPAQVA